MSSKEEILDKLSEAVISGNKDVAVEFSKKALDTGVDPLEAINQGLAKGISVIGKRYTNREIHVPEVLVAADAMHASLDILKPEIKAEKASELKEALKGLITACKNCGITFWKPEELKESEKSS